MKTFRVEITPEEMENLLFGEGPITQYDRFRIASFTTETLISRIGSDFTQEQLDEVYRIEEYNMKFLVRCFFSVYYNQEIFDYINSKYSMMEIYMGLKKEYQNDSIKLTASYSSACITGLLSNFDKSFEIKIRGKIPFKMFSYRQIEANKWYDSHCKFVIAVARQIFIKLGAMDSFLYVTANCSYYLNKSQPFRYCIYDNESMNDALYRLFQQYSFEDCESYAKEFSMKDVPFYKDL
jgi:hypothetical protein